MNTENQTVESIEAELLNTPHTESVEQHEENLAPKAKKAKKKKSVKDVIAENPEATVEIVETPKEPIEGSFGFVFAAPSFAEGIELATNGKPAVEAVEAIEAVKAVKAVEAQEEILAVEAVPATETEAAIKAVKGKPAVLAVEAVIAVEGVKAIEAEEAILPTIESCKNITEILDTDADYEDIKKYGSRKWFSIMDERIEGLKRNSAEGFQIVGKAARRAKAALGLKGKKGLKIYFVHGIQK
tara:strand:+ start:3809 stop:4534 length:726 start_codon:yes stop_codon:yes gene_type:complete